jgi:excisionase family DNA binding protein
MKFKSLCEVTTMTATKVSGGPGDVLTVRETAAKLGVSIRQVMTLIADGKLAGTYKLGLMRLIPKQTVEHRIHQVEQWKASHVCK